MNKQIIEILQYGLTTLKLIFAMRNTPLKIKNVYKRMVTHVKGTTFTKPNKQLKLFIILNFIWFF